MLPRPRCSGNDVSLYSGVLGAYLAGQDFRLEIQEEDFRWLEPFLGDLEGQAAAVMVLLEALKYEKANNLFKARHWAHYRTTLREFHRATGEKLQERKQQIRHPEIHLPGYFRPGGRDPEGRGGYRLSAHLRRGL